MKLFTEDQYNNYVESCKTEGGWEDYSKALWNKLCSCFDPINYKTQEIDMMDLIYDQAREIDKLKAKIYKQEDQIEWLLSDEYVDQQIEYRNNPNPYW